MSISRSQKLGSARRRPLAILLSIALGALGLSVAPLTVSSASAASASSLRAAILKDVNVWRVAQGAKAITLNSRLNAAMQVVSSFDALEFEGSVAPLSYYTYGYLIPSGGTNEFDSAGMTDPGSTSAQALEVAQAIETDDGATSDFLVDNFAGIGISNYEGRWDVYFTALHYSSVPVVSKVPHVSISGTPVVGSTLTAHSSILESTTTEVEYLWYVGGEIVQSGSGNTYTPCNCDVGFKVSVIVLVGQGDRDPSFGTATTSSAVILPSVKTAPVTVTGDRYVGHTLTATTGTWEPDGEVDFDYQWYRDNFPIQGETNDTYVQQPADVGHKITVRIWGDAGDDYLDSSILSTTNVKTGGPTLTNTTLPSVNGTYTVGQVLTADVGEWTEGTPTFTYQWKVAGVAVKGATKSKFTVPASAYSVAGKTITVDVTAHEVGFSNTTVTSGPTPTIAGLPFAVTGSLGYTGTAAVGATLKAVLPTYAPKATTITYAWKIGGTVYGAKSSYVVPASASGQTVALIVTASKSGYVSSVIEDDIAVP